MKNRFLTLLVLTTIFAAYCVPVKASWTQHGIDWDFDDACDVVVRDFGGDQYPDVAGLNTGGTINVYEGIENQEFVTHFAAQVSLNCRLLRAGDMDNDGDIDLIAASDATPPPGFIFLLLNQGNWRFEVAPIEDEYNHFDDLIVVDLDGDGDLDLAGIHTILIGEHLSWWENTLNGTIFNEHHICECDAKGLGYADLDQDGDIDLTIYLDGEVLWLENTGNQMFQRHIAAVNPPGTYINEVKPGDLNGDGDLDLLLGTYDGVYCYLNDGNLNFPRLLEIPSALGIHQVQVMEVDGDGWNDIACFSGTWGYVYWIENFMCRDYNDHTLSQPEVGIVRYDTCDFNGDGKIDFAVTGTITANNIQWYENGLNPAVKLRVIPQNTPIIIPPEGGSFDYAFTIWNTTSDTLIYDIWTSCAAEWGPAHSMEPVILFEDVILMPDTVFSRGLTQQIPAGVPEDEYYFEVKAGDYPHFIDEHYGFSFCVYPEDALLSGKPADMADDGENHETYYKLSASPNPFNAKTAISFELQAASQVELKVFDITGREAASLVTGHWSLGYHEVVWDASGIERGVYFVRMELQSAGTRQHEIRKVILLK